MGLTAFDMTRTASATPVAGFLAVTRPLCGPAGQRDERPDPPASREPERSSKVPVL